MAPLQRCLKIKRELLAIPLLRIFNIGIGLRKRGKLIGRILGHVGLKIDRLLFRGDPCKSSWKCALLTLQLNKLKELNHLRSYAKKPAPYKVTF